MLKYNYTVYMSTVQALNGEVTVESDHPLTDEEIAGKAIDLANDTDMSWERKDIAPDIDIDEIRKGASIGQ